MKRGGSIPCPSWNAVSLYWFENCNVQFCMFSFKVSSKRVTVHVNIIWRLEEDMLGKSSTCSNKTWIQKGPEGYKRKVLFWLMTLLISGEWRWGFCRGCSRSCGGIAPSPAYGQGAQTPSLSDQSSKPSTHSWFKAFPRRFTLGPPKVPFLWSPSVSITSMDGIIPAPV